MTEVARFCLCVKVCVRLLFQLIHDIVNLDACHETFRTDVQWVWNRVIKFTRSSYPAIGAQGEFCWAWFVQRCIRKPFHRRVVQRRRSSRPFPDLRTTSGGRGGSVLWWDSHRRRTSSCSWSSTTHPSPKSANDASRPHTPPTRRTNNPSNT